MMIGHHILSKKYINEKYGKYKVGRGLRRREGSAGMLNIVLPRRLGPKLSRFMSRNKRRTLIQGFSLEKKKQGTRLLKHVLLLWKLPALFFIEPSHNLF